MQDAAHDTALYAPARQAELCLGAFIAYEDVATGKRAKETCDVLTRQLGSDWQIEIEMSSFDSLHVPEVRHLATAAVTSANLIVFSCRDRDLPFHVWQWTELCLQSPDRPTALVALLAGGPCQTGSPRAAESYLAELAHRRGMRFFSYRHSSEADLSADWLARC
jgi:hypothetical protein